MKKIKSFLLVLPVFTALLIVGAVNSNRLFTFIAFSVKPGNNNTVLLQWETTGGNTIQFEVERSADNKEWKSIATIPPAISNKYGYTDTNPAEGYNYYRVKENQQGNQTIYSATNVIRVKKQIKIFIWPNPSGNEVNVQTTFTSGTIDVIDAAGKLLLKKTITQNITTLSIVVLKPGMYYLNIQHGEDKYTEEFIKM